MRPLFFGPSTAPLYGVVQEPVGDIFQDYAVLFCYPFGQEYMRSHRAFRHLSTQLARSGVPSLRFDYAGTGDSAGECVDFSFGECVDNARMAYEELQALAAVDKVHVIGLRLGASVALEAFSRQRDLRGLVLWDPVLDGAGYLRDLGRYAGENSGCSTDSDTWWVNGFPIGAGLREELTGFSADAGKVPKHCDVYQVVSAENQSYLDFAGALGSEGCKINHQYIAGYSSDWQRVDDEGSFLMPHDVLRNIVDRVCRNP